MENSFKHYSDMDISALVEGMSAGVLDYTFDDLKEVQTELVNRRMSSRYMGIVSGLMRNMIEQGRVEEEEDAESAQEDFAPVSPVFPSPIQPVKKIAPKPVTPVSTLQENLALIQENTSTPAPQVAPIAPPPPTAGVPAAGVPTAGVHMPTATTFTPPPAPIARAADTKHNNKPRANDERGYADRRFKEEQEYHTLEFLVGFFKVLAWVLVAATLAAYAYVALTMLAADVLKVVFAGGVAMTVSAIWLLICLAISESIQWKIDVAQKLGRG